MLEISFVAYNIKFLRRHCRLSADNLYRITLLLFPLSVFKFLRVFTASIAATRRRYIDSIVRVFEFVLAVAELGFVPAVLGRDASGR